MGELGPWRQIQTGDPSLRVIRVSVLPKTIEPGKAIAKRVWKEQRRGLQTMLGAVTVGEMRRSHHDSREERPGSWGVTPRVASGE